MFGPDFLAHIHIGGNIANDFRWLFSIEIDRAKLHAMPGLNPNLAFRKEILDREHPILESILGAVDVGIMLTDLEHNTLVVNDSFGQLFGIPMVEAIRNNPQTVRGLVQKRIIDFDAWQANLEQVYDDPTSVQEDLLFLQEPHQVLERKTIPILGDDHVPIARLWTFADISKRHHRVQIDSLLQSLSVKFDPNPRKVYDHIVQALAEFYNSTCILSILEGERMKFQSIASAIVDVSNETGNELRQSFCQFCLENDGPIIIQNALENSVYSAMMPVQLGITRYAGVPLRSSDGTVFGTLCVLDHHKTKILGGDDLRLLSLMGMRISGELMRESHLSRLEQDLAHAQKQMIQNEKLAVAGTLSASIAHDIRNIVSAITVDLDGDYESAVDRLDRARVHMERFNVLALRLLSYAKPKEISTQKIELSDAMHKVAELLHRHLQISNVDLVVDFAPDFPEIEADPSRIEHLLMNLCLNALQAVKSGGIIKVIGRAEDGQAIIEVSDTGKGMPAEQVQNAFKPFQSSRPDGFGLGLYSCQQIVNESGGTIAVSSSDHGTTFTIRFPLP